MKSQPTTTRRSILHGPGAAAGFIIAGLLGSWPGVHAATNTVGVEVVASLRYSPLDPPTIPGSVFATEKGENLIAADADTHELTTPYPSNSGMAQASASARHGSLKAKSIVRWFHGNTPFDTIATGTAGANAWFQDYLIPRHPLYAGYRAAIDFGIAIHASVVHPRAEYGINGGFWECDLLDEKGRVVAYVNSSYAPPGPNGEFHVILPVTVGSSVYLKVILGAGAVTDIGWPLGEAPSWGVWEAAADLSHTAELKTIELTVNHPTQGLIKVKDFTLTSASGHDYLTPTSTLYIVTDSGSPSLVDGGFGFAVGGATNQTVVIERSPDLSTWTSLSTNVLGSVPFQFTDPAASREGRFFYRVRGQ